VTTRKSAMAVIQGGAAQLPSGPRKISGTYTKTAPWSDREEVLLRHEVEIRYRERTPPRSSADQNPRERVSLEEMLLWSMETQGKIPPQTDIWEKKYFEWYDLMVERNPVHQTWLDDFALCGAKGEMPPLRTGVESEVTCENCKLVFGRPEDEGVAN